MCDAFFSPVEGGREREISGEYRHENTLVLGIGPITDSEWVGLCRSHDIVGVVKSSCCSSALNWGGSAGP